MANQRVQMRWLKHLRKKDGIHPYLTTLKMLNSLNTYKMTSSNDKNFLKTERTLADEIRDSHKALSDLWQGVSAFEKIKNCVTVYGSARFKEGHPYYELARNM